MIPMEKPTVWYPMMCLTKLHLQARRKEWMKPMEAHPLEGPHHFDSLFVIVRFAHVEFLHECL